MWTKKSNKKLLPSAEEVYAQKGERVWPFVHEVFRVVGMHDVRILLKAIVQWVNNVLTRFSRELSPDTRNEPHTGLWNDFYSGVVLAYLIHAYAAPADRPDFS